NSVDAGSLRSANRCNGPGCPRSTRRYHRALSWRSDRGTQGCSLGIEPGAPLPWLLWREFDGTPADRARHHPANTRVQAGHLLSAETIMENTIYISDVIDAPIEKVWGIMRDFNDMPAYHPAIKKSAIESGCSSDQVGCLRHLTLADGFVRERLLCLDDKNYVF